MQYPQNITEAHAIELGLLPDEFLMIQKYLGRNPNYTELSIYSVMWSEHCSYKNSITWLKTLPREGKLMLAKAGEENAGLIDMGDNIAVAFKIESHNHPSAIEPYQGAATGVGGIHRDIFTMGARPIASLNSLRFGSIQDPKTRHLLRGVVKGISGYGNAFGVPTVGGEVFFEDCYLTNPLVNAMSIGVTTIGKTVRAIAEGIGNIVYIVGATTGKDGIHGATFASEEITEDSAEKLPSVQVGDPFLEKLLLEATLELIETQAVVGMQDMGAAGIICSTSEMCAKGECGMNIYLDKVPTRQANMEPYEILLSESQERMLVIVKKGREKEVEKIFDKWDLHCAAIGEVIDDENLYFYKNENLVAKVPAQSLVLGGGAPVYKRDYETADYHNQLKDYNKENLPDINNLMQTTEKVLSLTNVASKRWVYEQYDSMVGITNATTNKPSDAALIRISGTNKMIAATVDCNAKYIYANPKIGTMIAVTEAARNLVCSGAKPAAITNCLNFGNPYDKQVYWQFVKAIEGMGDACRAFDTPVTGGNVSFYNQSPEGGAVYPTPTIGMVGVLEHPSLQLGLSFQNIGDAILLLGTSTNDINCSEYLSQILHKKDSIAPYYNLDEELSLQKTIAEANELQYLNSAHDVSQGGLIVCLLESAFPHQLGFTIHKPSNMRNDAFYFGEGQGKVIVSVSNKNIELMKTLCEKNNVPLYELGTVSANIVVDNETWGDVNHYKDIYETALPQWMEV